MIRHRFLVLAIAAAVASASLTAAAASARGTGNPAFGAVYTASNDAAGNAVLVFDRLADGALVPGGSIATGGLGSGAGLGNQGALVLTSDERWLLAVNAGSDSVSVLGVGESSLALADVAASGGIQPISVTTYRDLVYVLNAGSESIAGFRLDPNGHLAPLTGSIQPLGGSGNGPAEIGFSPDGNFLVVTEKNANAIAVFPVGSDGLAGAPLVQPSVGTTPFGFAFGKRGQLLVSEAAGGAAGASTESSYELGSDGVLTPISAAAPDNQSANCWTAIAPNGRFAYVTNTGSGSISGYGIDFGGHIALLDDDGVTAITGGSPIDLAFAQNGQFLYALAAGATDTLAAFHVQADGSLAALPFVDGLPGSANGLAVR
jgi:6-phosphogluconolactonase